MRLSDKVARDSEVAYLKNIVSRMVKRLRIQTLSDEILRQEAIQAVATGGAR